MKKIFVLITILAGGFQAEAQVKSALWLMFGGEMRQGTYSRVNDFYRADSYNMFNRTTFRFETIEPKALNMSVDATGLLTYSQKNHGQSDSTFRYVWDRPRFRWSMYKLKGDAGKSTRFGIGGQINWRLFGIGEEFGKHVRGSSNKAGPLTAKSRFGIGPNFHLVHQFGRRLYSRVSLYADYEPGLRTNGISVYPEAVLIANYKAIGIMANVSYRYSYFYGDPNNITYLLEPTKSASAKTLIFGLSAGLNLGKWM